MDRIEAKSRGKKHIKDKQKYKNRNKASNTSDVSLEDQSSDTEFGCRPLNDNWKKFDEIESDDVDSTDFALLASAPISQGGHFQFKSDKNDNFKEEELQLFKLDLQLISEGLSTIPFFIRCSIPKDLFKEREIQEMELKAEVKRDKYLQFLFNSRDKVQENKNKLEEKTINCEIGYRNQEKKNVVDLTTKNVRKNTEKENLEEWLDDFLDS